MEEARSDSRSHQVIVKTGIRSCICTHPGNECASSPVLVQSRQHPCSACVFCGVGWDRGMGSVRGISRDLDFFKLPKHVSPSHFLVPETGPAAVAVVVSLASCHIRGNSISLPEPGLCEAALFSTLTTAGGVTNLSLFTHFSAALTHSLIA